MVRFLVKFLAPVLVLSACSDIGVPAGSDEAADATTDVAFQLKDSHADLETAGLTDANTDDGLDIALDATQPTAGDFKKPCQENSDCESGYCVATANGKVCSSLCSDACPNGWWCQQVASGSDSVYICKPRFDTLCSPCEVAADCNLSGGLDNVCVSYGGKGSFCAAACDPAKNDCPEGYGCQETTDPGTGENGNQCVPLSGQCTCTDAAKVKLAKTTCWKTNVLGKCKGTRFCGPGGLTDCSAAMPEEESCNGVDDDCNGVTDENLGSAKCSKANSFGVCFGVTPGCFNGQSKCNAKDPTFETCNGEDDDCDGQTDEAVCDDGNSCTADSCDPGSGCKHATTGGACDDGNVCTQKDTCAATFCVGGNLQDCDDQNPCTTDVCDAVNGCTHSFAAAGATCIDDGDPCTSDTCDGGGTCVHLAGQGLCKINGQCVPAGFVNPANPCEVCAPTSSTTAFTTQNGLTCDDGDLCTIGDKCTAGTCSGAPMDCSGQAGQCTKAVCSQGICVVSPKAALCSDGDPCTLDDVCVGGVCKGNPKDCSGLDDACFIGVCNGGNCAQAPKLGSCDDGDPCTVGDTCAGGGCKGTPMDCTSMDSACGSAQCVTGACKFKSKSNGTACDDGNACTESDTCQSGGCAGTPKDCSTLDGGCVQGVCSAGTCFAKVQTGVCNDGDACTANDMCVGASCVGEPVDCSGFSSACGTSVCQSGICTQPIGGECKPGEISQETQPCGNCGSQNRTRTCSGGCTWGPWSDWGTCGGQGVCAPGAQENQTCGNCGTQSRTCSNTCTWASWGTCGGAGPCAPGATKDCGDTSGNAACRHTTCSSKCQWGSCAFKSGKVCDYNSGTNYKCCTTASPHGHAYCSADCTWFSCQADVSPPYSCP